jgi:hypothetical protein
MNMWKKLFRAQVNTGATVAESKAAPRSDTNATSEAETSPERGVTAREATPGSDFESNLERWKSSGEQKRGYCSIIKAGKKTTW